MIKKCKMCGEQFTCKNNKYKFCRACNKLRMSLRSHIQDHKKRILCLKNKRIQIPHKIQLEINESLERIKEIRNILG